MKKITKRFLAMFMALAMICSLSVFAFAEEVEPAESAETFLSASTSSLEDELALTDYVFESTTYSEGWFYLPAQRYVWIVINTPSNCNITVYKVPSNGSTTMLDMTYTGLTLGSNITRQIQLPRNGSYNQKWSAGWYYFVMSFGSNSLHAYRYMSRNTQPG